MAGARRWERRRRGAISIGGEKGNTGLPSGVSGKEPTANADVRDGFDPRVRKIPWGGHGSPLQYSCLEDPLDRGAWQAAVRGVAKSQK